MSIIDPRYYDCERVLGEGWFLNAILSDGGVELCRVCGHNSTTTVQISRVTDDVPYFSYMYEGVLNGRMPYPSADALHKCVKILKEIL